MAACHPKLKTHPGAELFLSRFADGDWRGIVRPWLESGRGTLSRSIVVAPTRGQTQALKQRCVEEGVALLGVEFLTPGLARKKRGAQNGIGRSLQVLVLKAQIEARIAPLSPEDPARLVWKSLASDLEAALSDYEDLLRGELGAKNFPSAELRELFGGLERWLAEHRYALGPVLDRQDAVSGDGPGQASPADRALILAGGPENWPDFFGLLALAQRCPSVCVVVAEPDFGGRSAPGEAWVEVWERALGVEQRVSDAPDPADNCSEVAELWMGGEGSAGRAEAIVARSRTEEIELVAERIESLLASGSENIAVIFPKAAAGQARLARILEGRGVAFADLIGGSGTPPVDTRIQRALADFYERGCRLEELLLLWPLLGATNATDLSPGGARAACQRFFDEFQSHSIEQHAERMRDSEDPGEREVGRIALLLLPSWPESLTPKDALLRFDESNRRMGLVEPEGWYALRDFAARVVEPMPRAALLEAIRSFLPERGPLSGGQKGGGFARVSLTTCRRAVGVSWSDSIFVESNAGIWPERREPSCWLGDEPRRELCRALGRHPMALPTSDDRSALEKRLYCSVARDTRKRVIFTAALFSEEEPELKLGPNVWLERVMWSKGLFSPDRGGADAFERLARSQAGGAPQTSCPKGWGQVWDKRRDPAAPFDAHFLGDPSGASRPARLSASQIERAVKDPATLWFDAVLGVRRVEWRPFARARGKAVGTAVHRALGVALRGTPVEGSFGAFPELGRAAERLEAELQRIRQAWPRDRYWDSFHGDVTLAARELLQRVYELPPSPFCAVEARLPGDATVTLPLAGPVPVTGRMDLVLSDKPAWGGAQVEIVDYKTGGDARLSARRMGSSGASLQLGVYLQAAASVGASGGVWMLKPDQRPSRIGQDEIGRATAQLRVVGQHLVTGICGARTADRDEYTHIFEWPLASSPVPQAVLEAKFRATFGEIQVEGTDE